jgi:hypothetical protein
VKDLVLRRREGWKTALEQRRTRITAREIRSGPLGWRRSFGYTS